MKRLHLIIYMALVCLGLHARESDPGEQLLVFRNTGVVDLLYTNEVDSVVTRDTEQVFYAKDTVLVVPFSELDSVAVGNRNQMVFHEGVRELTNSVDLPWIISFDGTSIFYRLDTPSDILPEVGMKLFYGLDGQKNEKSIFPYGLCSKVVAVTMEDNCIRVDIEIVEIDEIFIRLFYAGELIQNRPVASKRKKAERYVSEELEANIPIPLGDYGSLDINGTVKVSGKVVTDIRWRKRYYHADLDLDYSIGFDVALTSDDSEDIDVDFYDADKIIASVYKVLDLSAAIGAYVEAKAELSVSAGMKRSYHRKLIWTRQNGEDSFEFFNPNPEEPYKNEARAELTLDGRLSFGPVLRLDFGVVGKVLGARAKLKLGPEIEGKLGLGILRIMRNYTPQIYGTSELTVGSRIKLEGFGIHRHYLVWGDVDEHKFLELSYPFAQQSWRPFPEYQHTNAVASTNLQPSINIATNVVNPPITDIEMGFEIVDPQGEVVDSMFVDTILAEPADTTVAQTFEAELPLPPTIKHEDLEGYTMRPIFRYAGYTISAAPVGIKKDVLLQPYTSTQTNGAMTFISSGPFLDSTVADSTLYFLGTWMPVPLKNNIYQQGKDKPAIVVGKHIDETDADLLIGTWQGQIGDEALTLLFEEDGTGKYNDLTFHYEVNSPQTGELLLTFEDAPSRVFQVISINETQLTLSDKSRAQQGTIILSRQ